MLSQHELLRKGSSPLLSCLAVATLLGLHRTALLSSIKDATTVADLYDSTSTTAWALRINIGVNSMYMNKGYDDGRRPMTMPLAMENLARKVGVAANLSEDTSILDVGPGFGDADFLWVQKFGARHITGINIAAKEVALANKRARALDLECRVNFLEMDAAHMDRTLIRDGSFDRIIGIESPFYFHTRELFFREAFKKLKRGGKMILVDEIAADMGALKELTGHYREAELHIPQNWWTQSMYFNHLMHEGFHNVAMEDLTEHTVIWPGRKAPNAPLIEMVGDLYNLSTKSLLEYFPFMISNDESREWSERTALKRQIMVFAEKS